MLAIHLHLGEGDGWTWLTVPVEVGSPFHAPWPKTYGASFLLLVLSRVLRSCPIFLFINMHQ